MKRVVHLLGLFLLLALQACGGEPADRLAGIWRCDGRATFALMAEAGSMSEEQLAAGVAVLEKMSLEINRGAGVLNLHLGEASEKIPYSITEKKGNRFALELGGGSTATLELQEANTLLLTDSRTPNRIIVFKRHN